MIDGFGSLKNILKVSLPGSDISLIAYSFRKIMGNSGLRRSHSIGIGCCASNMTSKD